MAREPSYPKDARVTPPPAAQAAAAGSEGVDTAGGGEAAAEGSDSRRRKQIMTGAAIGIGSAALVAALLYANRSRRDRS
jgi:hypothetical protein